jgi:3-oxoacyl-[acyl-carrier protein] reductase
VASLFAKVVSEFGTVDILVNNAALVPGGPRSDERRGRFYQLMTTPVAKSSVGVTKELSDEEWHRYWDVNLHGVFYCTREALRIMEPKKSGKIINISSIAGTSAYSAFEPAYSASKGAVLAFTRAVAVDVAGANIFVNAIACGGILTPAMEAVLSSLPEAGRNAMHQMIPLGRLGKPDEYAWLAVYLATNEHYLGQTLSPNGGMVL